MRSDDQQCGPRGSRHRCPILFRAGARARMPPFARMNPPLALSLAASLVLGPTLLTAAPVRVDRDVEARMRDGVVLRADVLRPDVPGRFPALLVRTPYGKQSEWGEDDFAFRAARAGYVVVVQDVRGRYRSEGVFDPYRQEGRDGFDTIAWVAGLPFCDGQVGLTGLSYPAAVQWLAAVEAPPQLKAMAPAMTFSSGRSFCYFGGAFDLSWLPWFYKEIAPDVRRRLGLSGPKTARRGGPGLGGERRCVAAPSPATHPSRARGRCSFLLRVARPPRRRPVLGLPAHRKPLRPGAGAGAEPLGLARRGLRPGRRRPQLRRHAPVGRPPRDRALDPRHADAAPHARRRARLRERRRSRLRRRCCCGSSTAGSRESRTASTASRRCGSS